MTVFLLSMYICSTFNFDTGELRSKTCHWQSSGQFWENKESCENEGQQKVGKLYFSDVTDGAIYENYKCYSQRVWK